MSEKSTVRLKGFEEYQQALNEYRLFSGKCMRDVLLEEAALTAREIMVFTPPIVRAGGKGLSKAAEITGRDAVAKDIRSIFNSDKDPDGKSAFAMMGMAVVAGDSGLFEKARKEGVSTSKARGIFKKVLDDPDPQRAFQQFTNRFKAAFEAKAGQTVIKDLKGTHNKMLAKYAGRVRRNGGPGVNKALRPMAEEAALVAYIKAEQRKVGKLKAGWYDVIMGLPKPTTPGVHKNFGVRGIPSWVIKNSKNNGYLRFSGNQDTANFMLTIGNAIGDNDSVATDASTLNKVMAIRTGKLLKRADHLMMYGVDKFNR